jgi:HEAT repeat protein
MPEQILKFDKVVEALLDLNQPFPPRLLRNFSDLSHKDQRTLSQLWLDIEHRRKLSLFEDLEAIAETDTLVNFDEFAKFGITDPDPAVRVMSIRLLWECEEAGLIPVFTELMQSDPAEDVRAAAASALGKFVYLGELDSIPDNLKISLVQNLLDVVKGEDLPLVRRNALESLGYSSNTKVPGLINTALDSGDSQWMISALFAIGRSADEQWAETVLKYLDRSENEIKFEAVRAAGELELDEARDMLLELLVETEDDLELRYAVIWSLSQIGGEGIKESFDELLKKSEDEEEIVWLERALENLDTGGDIEKMEFLNFEGEPEPLDDDEEDESDLDDKDLDLEDLEEEEDEKDEDEEDQY